MTSPQARSAEITQILDEVERVWRRNPDRSFGELVAFATARTSAFTPFDVTDLDVLATLQSVAPGLGVADHRTAEIATLPSF